MNVNTTGSRDIGVMQINTGWLPALRRYGIDEGDLWDPCTNVHVGAWVMAGNIQRLGWNWDAIGAYNAKSPEKRRKYAWRVYRAMPPSIPTGDGPGH
jgi:soluble lytic murein transglycosylase-like protein